MALRFKLTSLCFTFAILFSLAIPAVAQIAPRAPDVTVSAVDIDETLGAAPLHGYIQVEVTGFNGATSNASDPQASCHPTAPGQPDETVWFEFAVGSGTLSLSTVGSAFTTTGASAAHILTVYRAGGTDLIEVGCDTGITGDQAQLNGLHLSAGIYQAVVGVPDGDTVSSGNLLVTMDFTPDTPISNDDFANAKTLKFPANPSVLSLENATYEPGEIVSSCALSERPSNSIWYKFTVDYTAIASSLVLYAQGLGVNSLNTESVLITVFEEDGFGLVELVCDTDSTNPSIFRVYEPGTYYIRIESDNMGGLALAGIVQWAVNPSISQGVPFFKAADSVTPDFTGWSVKNDSPEDGIECSVSACTYVMHSSGAAEATQLKTSASLSNLKMKKNDMLALTMQYSSESPDATAKVIVKYTDGRAPTKFSGDLNTPGVFQQFFIAQLMPSGKILSIKVKIKNNDTTLNDELDLHLVFLNTIRVGESHTREVLPLPLPPSLQ